MRFSSSKPDLPASSKARRNPSKTEVRGLQMWRFLFRYLRHYRGLLVVAMACSALTGACLAAQPLVIKYIVDNGICGDWGTKGEAFCYCLLMSLVYVAISTLRVLSWRVGYVDLLKSMENAMFRLRADVFASIQHKCMRFYAKNSPGELYNCVLGSPMTNIRTYMNQVIMCIPYQIVAFAISLAALSSFNWALTLLMVAVALVMTLITCYCRRKVRKAAGEYLDSERATSKYISDVLNGVNAVKVYSIEDEMIANLRARLGDYRDKGFRFSRTSTISSLKPEYVQYLGTAVIYVVGAAFCIWGEDIPGGRLSTGELYAFLASMTSILGILNSWFGLSFVRSTAEASLEKIVATMEEATSTPEIKYRDLHTVSHEEGAAISAGKPCIEFSHVDFAYGSQPVFSDFSCSVKYGESIGLVGESGSGKSTFTKLVMRLYDTDGGEVKVHGVNVRNYSTRDLRRSIGIVPQDPFIFYGSIADNVKITRPDASPDEVRRAMDVAHVTDFLADMPSGAETIIGSGAMSLSGGQKQRVAIARAVLKNPDILVFDEATSALDNKSERLIQQSVEKLMERHTVVIVAHRLSTVRNVDRILVFDHGRIVEEGTYRDLSLRNGVFAGLLKAQSE